MEKIDNQKIVPTVALTVQELLDHLQRALAGKEYPNLFIPANCTYEQAFKAVAEAFANDTARLALSEFDDLGEGVEEMYRRAFVSEIAKQKWGPEEEFQIAARPLRLDDDFKPDSDLPMLNPISEEDDARFALDIREIEKELSDNPPEFFEFFTALLPRPLDPAPQQFFPECRHADDTPTVNSKALIAETSTSPEAGTLGPPGLGVSDHQGTSEKGDAI